MTDNVNITCEKIPDSPIHSHIYPFMNTNRICVSNDSDSYWTNEGYLVVTNPDNFIDKEEIALCCKYPIEFAIAHESLHFAIMKITDGRTSKMFDGIQAKARLRLGEYF